MECLRTARPDTILDGSDVVEAVGWACLAVPGWLYCAWRHALRRKVCRFCGGESLMREARAAAARRGGKDDSASTIEVRSRSGSALWPRSLAEPRTRLRRGLVGALLGGWAMAGWGVAASTRGLGVQLGAEVATTVAVTWLFAVAARLVQQRWAERACRAWAGDGRSLRIEML